MSGLPRMKDTTRPRDCWQVMVCGGVERLTEALRRGDAFDAQSLADMEELCRRLEGFRMALDARKQLVEVA
jgi:predicted transcriptional regulator of viral defense system